LWVSCVGGRRYFPYYSYSRKPTGREFFIPARTLIVVFLLKALREANGAATTTTTVDDIIGALGMENEMIDGTINEGVV
jgi:hypothetical protein